MNTNMKPSTAIKTGLSTFRIAYLAGTDAANRNMRADGRTRWNDADYAISCAEFERVMGPECRREMK